MNHNTKKILSTVMLVLVVIILAIFAFKYKSNFSSTATTTPTVEANNPSDNGGIVEINPQFPGQTLPLSNDPKDIAWAVFQKYLNYNKDLNLEGVRSIVYKIASVCNDPKTTIDCKARMNSAYQYGSALKKENLIPDETRDTFLSLHLNKTTPWGYRNEINYDIGTKEKPKLLDIATTEYFIWLPTYSSEEKISKNCLLKL